MAEQADGDHDSHNTSPVAAQIEQIPGISAETLSAETIMLCMIPPSRDGVIASANSPDHRYGQFLHAVISAEGQTFGIATLFKRTPMGLSEFTRIVRREDVDVEPTVVPEKTDTVQALVKVDAEGKPKVVGVIGNDHSILGTHEGEGESESDVAFFAVQELNGAAFILHVGLQGSTTVLTAQRQVPGGQLAATETFPQELLVQPEAIDHTFEIRDSITARQGPVSQQSYYPDLRAL